MGYATGLEAALRERDAAIERLRREREDIMGLTCNTCGAPFGSHQWGYHGTGPFDGLVCPSNPVGVVRAKKQARYHPQP